MTSREHIPIFAAPELDRDQENRTALFQVCEAARRAKTQEQLLRRILETVRTGFGWVYASYFSVVRHQGLEPVLCFAFDSGEVRKAFRQATAAARFTRGEDLAGLAWQRRDLVFVEDVTRAGDFLRAGAALASGLRSGFWVPVTSGTQVIGTVELFCPERLRPGKGRMAALRAIQGILATALRGMRGSERLLHAGAPARTAGHAGSLNPDSGSTHAGASPA